VVFTTYQSGRSISGAVKKAGITFDLGIMDEAHKTVGKIDHLFNYLLDDNNISIKKRIFMTATERHYLGQSEQIASMNDLGRYGETFYQLSFKDALESDPPILSDYRIITMIVDKSEISDLIKKNILVRPDKGKWDREVEAEMLASAIALRKAMMEHPIKHAVSFHKSISRAKAFKEMQDNLSDAFPYYGELATHHVSGKTPTGIRVREIESFTKANRSLITNARCLTEGVDVPNIDCVLFADPRKSTVDIVQAVGRALRTASGKQLGYVIVPILIDGEATEIDISTIKTAYTPILTVLRALAANDDRIIEYFRSISIGRKATGGLINIDIDIPDGVSLDAEKFVNSLELQLWSRLAKLSWRPFEEARRFVLQIGLKNNTEWRKFCKGELKDKGTLPEDIPANPSQVYKGKGWVSFGDWLGTGNISPLFRQFRSFEEARKFVHQLGLKNTEEWRKFCKGELKEKGTLPDDIPANPNQIYDGKGWVSLGDWLGTGTIANRLRQYRSFEEARKFVRQLRLENNTEWRNFCKGELKDKGTLPEDIPAAPDRLYKGKGWVGFGDWLGTCNISAVFRHSQFRPFEEARAFVHQLGLKSQTEWREFCRGELKEKETLPEDIPASPVKTYRGNGWVSFGDWLGTGNIAFRFKRHLSFEEARAFVHQLGLKNTEEWHKFCKGELKDKGTLPDDIPANPNEKYKGKGWVSFGDWLGTGIVAPRLRQYRSFEEARAFVRGLELRSSAEWRKFCKGELKDKGTLPKDIPANPRSYKGKGWVSMGDWLGTGTVASWLRQYRSFGEARKFVHQLRLKNVEEWRKFCKGELKGKGKIPEDIPVVPYQSYKGKGWISFGDWLGTGNISNRSRHYRPFIEARAFVHQLGLKNTEEWHKFCKGELKGKGKLPEDIPTNPNQKYKGEGWVSFGDWLGTGYVAHQLRHYRSFGDARKFVHKLGLKNVAEWRKFCKGELKGKGKMPEDIPADPRKIYKTKGWRGMRDWLDSLYTKTSSPKERI
jgi:hypothetical protein